MDMNKLLAIAAMGLASSLSNAANFDFTGHGNAAAAANQTVDGITVTVSAPGEDLGYYNLDGLGVKTGFFNLPGLQNGETLRVDFSETVDIATLTMRQWEGPDAIVLVGWGDGTPMSLNNDSCAFCSAETFNVGLTGIDYLTITGDSALTVTLLAGLGGVTASAVPVPAAAWLFGSALIGLAGIGRQRKAA
jgi:hypothetical protein